MRVKLFYPLLLFLLRAAFANVLFLPRGGIYPSFDHWTLHLPITTRTTWTFATKLEYRIRLFKNKFSLNFGPHRQHQFRSDLVDHLWGKFMKDSNLLDQEMNVTIAALQHLKPSDSSDSARHKRSLLPFVGDAMSSLFGTATSTEIQDILSRVNDLSDSRDDMLNVIDNTMTMFNQTIVDVDMNRKTINQLTNATNYLTNRLDQLKDVVMDNYVASDLESVMDSVFTDLVTTIREFRKSVMDLETIFSLTENGILPRSLLPPSHFATILDDIQKALPRELALPFSASDTDKYYSTAHTKTMRTEGGVSVVVTIPLLSISDHFNVFQVFNVPVPKSFDEQSFVANYEAEKATFVALSDDSLKFITIDDADFHVYMRRKMPFCPIRRPIVNVLTSTLCVPALLTNQTDKIDRFCEKVIRVNQTDDPTAEYLGNGHWIVIGARPLDIEIRCKTGVSVNSTRVVKTVFPLSLVKLDFGCAAFTSYFQLPTHFRTDSHLKPYQVRHLNQTLALNDVWNQVSTSLSEHNVPIDHAMKMLPPVQTKTVTLSALKEHIRVLKYQSRYHYRVTVPALSVTGAIVLVTIVLLTVRYVGCPSVDLSFLTRGQSRSHPDPTGLTDTGPTSSDAANEDRPDSAPRKPEPTTAPRSWLPLTQ